jgi:hypothetical protein
MKEKKESTHISPTFEDDLHHIENALEDEFTFLFYVSMLRTNNHLASHYPLTTRFLGDQSRDFRVPKYFLDQIVVADQTDQIRDKLRKWIAQSENYQKLALKEIEDRRY